jgi:hypothetical protein
MPHVVVQYEFSPPATAETLRSMGTALGPCTRMRGIRRIRTVVSADGRQGYCEFEAPDAETVREAYRIARVPFLAVWSSSVVNENEEP